MDVVALQTIFGLRFFFYLDEPEIRIVYSEWHKRLINKNEESYGGD